MLHVAQELPHDYKHFVRYLLTSQQTERDREGRRARIHREKLSLNVSEQLKSRARHV